MSENSEYLVGVIHASLCALAAQSFSLEHLRRNSLRRKAKGQELKAGVRG